MATPQKPQPQRGTQSQEAGEESNEELKEKQNKVKINSSEHYESDYRRAEEEKGDKKGQTST